MKLTELLKSLGINGEAEVGLSEESQSAQSEASTQNLSSQSDNSPQPQATASTQEQEIPTKTSSTVEQDETIKKLEARIAELEKANRQLLTKGVVEQEMPVEEHIARAIGVFKEGVV